jgi:hypothetical protein
MTPGQLMAPHSTDVEGGDTWLRALAPAKIQCPGFQEAATESRNRFGDRSAVVISSGPAFSPPQLFQKRAWYASRNTLILQRANLPALPFKNQV